MEEKSPRERRLIKIEEISLVEMSLEHKRRAEQLFHQLGLEPVIDKVLKEFSNSLSGMDRVTDKIFGPYDVKGRVDAVAKVAALATYVALSEQYSNEVGNFESQITTLEGERDKVRSNYDKLVQRVADIVGGDYNELKGNYNELVQRLAAVERFRTQIATLNKEKAQLTERCESQVTEFDSKIKGLESEKATLTSELEQLRENYDQLKTAIMTVAGAIPYEEIRTKLGEELYPFLLKDSKVPDMVIDGVGKFIDFRKYLGVAVDRGAREAGKRAEEILRETTIKT